MTRAWWFKFALIALADLAIIAWIFIQVRRDERADRQRRKEYRVAVIDALTKGIEATRTVLNQVLSFTEEDEMDEAYDLGVPAQQFALRLRARDIVRWEADAKPHPTRVFLRATARKGFTKQNG